MSKHPSCPDRDSHGPHTITVGGLVCHCPGYDTPQPRGPKR